MNNYQAFACKATGASHIRHNKECQDACADNRESSTFSEMSIAVVADGHGDDNCFRSAKGSRFAAACAIRGIEDFINYLQESEEKQPRFSPKKLARIMELSEDNVLSSLRERLVQNGIRNAWYKSVDDDFLQFPFTDEELKQVSEKYHKLYKKSEKFHHAYGTTLIAAAITKDFWLGFQVGDGRLTALYPDGSFYQLPLDEKCFLNQTTSICDDDANEVFHYYFSFHKDKPAPVAVILCSDGIDDNYPMEDNEIHLFKLYRTIALTFAEDGFESTCKQLDDLVKQFAEKGKADDSSIAGFIDMEALKDVVPIWQEQIVKETDSEKAAEKNVPEEQEKKTEKSKLTVTQKALAAIDTKQKEIGSEEVPPNKVPINIKRANEAYEKQIQPERYGKFVSTGKDGKEKNNEQ